LTLSASGSVTRVILLLRTYLAGLLQVYMLAGPTIPQPCLFLPISLCLFSRVHYCVGFIFFLVLWLRCIAWTMGYLFSLLGLLFLSFAIERNLLLGISVLLRHTIWILEYWIWISCL
jgi:hypothetical protein